MIDGVDNDSLVYLNGDYVRLGDAKISVLDRGFIFGDGVYDVVPAYSSKPFRMQQHLERLLRSLKYIGIDTGWAYADWEKLVLDMLQRQPQVADYTVYIQVSRGVAKREHGFPDGVKPTIFCMVSAMESPSATVLENGYSAVSMTDERWLHCHIKSTSLLGNVLAKQYANDAGVDDVLQFRNGNLTEGSSSNIWVVKNGSIRAPLRDNLILEGIRYSFFVELANSINIPLESRPISKLEVETADELMLSSATKRIVPIVSLDGKPVGDGKPGPIFKKMAAAYDSKIAQLRAQ